MRQGLKTSFLNDKITAQENVNLDIQFDVITLQLRECALHEPGIDLDKDKEMFDLESKLLSLQEDILEKTTQVRIANDEDFQLVKKLWQSVIDLKQDSHLNLSNRLASSLFKYTEKTLNLQV